MIDPNEKYYSSSKDKPKISHTDFSSDPVIYEFGDEHKILLVKFLLSIEERYECQFKKTKLKTVSDNRIVNELFNTCYLKFKEQISPIYLIDEICAFFNFDLVEFYDSLEIYTQNMIKKLLSKTVSLDLFERRIREESIEKNEGYVQKKFIPRQK